MRQAVKDELFLTDLNATMEDFEDPHNETAMAVAPAERDVYNNALF
jgi:hypothetical protein